MADLAAHLVDRVLPYLAVRQWVLALPDRVRFLLACDPALLSKVRRIFTRTVLAWMKTNARRRGLRQAQSGAVCFVQRFDSALRVNVHFHMLVLDGVYVETPGGPVFHELPPPRDTDLVHLTQKLHDRILGFLVRSGRLPQDDDSMDQEEPSAHATCIAAAVQGRKLFGKNAGSPTPRLGRQQSFVPDVSPKKLACRIAGFSLHAGVRVGEHSRFRLEKLCRYVARPPLVTDRLSQSHDGKIVYSLKSRWRDGSTHVVFDPLTFLARLAALVPRPRFPLVTYHGVLAPAARMRKHIVPEPLELVSEDTTAESHPSAPPETTPKRERRLYYSWAELMQRVFRADVLQCPCGGRRSVIALITDRSVIYKILTHLGIATEPPAISAARAPPARELAYV